MSTESFFKQFVVDDHEKQAEFLKEFENPKTHYLQKSDCAEPDMKKIAETAMKLYGEKQ